jgi:hypothetical protein
VTPDSTLRRLAGWWLLLALLLLTAILGLRHDRSQWPGMIGDEATYAMQAASLAWDGDLAYERRDFDRFVEQWGAVPENLILQSTDGGETLTYGKPFLYALTVAPWLRLAPQRGAVLANLFFVVLAALAAARTLERRVGPTAPAWIAVALFASASFVYVLWFHADLFLLSMTAIGLALVLRGEQQARTVPSEIYGLDLVERRGRLLMRWGLAGVLLAVPTAVRPFHLAILIAAAFAAPRERRSAALLAYGLGAGLVLGGGLLVHRASGGSYMGYGSERQGFYSYTGYPDVDFPRQEWRESVERWGNTSWIHDESLSFRFDADLWKWNALYLVVGRHVGVLPYFLPLVLGLLAFGGDRVRGALLVASVLVMGCFLLVRPFNFWGGSGAVANRYFLPLYPVFWLLGGRRLHVGWLVAVVVGSGLFLWPLWLDPLSFPLGDDGGYRHTTIVARELLPYETTQSHLKPGGRDDVTHNGLWVKFLTPGADVGGSKLLLPGGAHSELLVGSPTPLEALVVAVAGPDELDLEGGEPGEILLRPDGGTGYELLLEGHLRARHPMWWAQDPFYLYQLELRPTGSGVARVEIWPGPLRSPAVSRLSLELGPPLRPGGNRR